MIIKLFAMNRARDHVKLLSQRSIKLFHLFINFEKHLSLINKIYKYGYWPIYSKSFKAQFKYLGDIFHFSMVTATRRMFILNHYEFMYKNFGQDFPSIIMNNDITLLNWQLVHTYSIHLGIPIPGITGREGELRLSFVVNGISVYHIIFSFIDGHLLELGDGYIIFIGASQGSHSLFPLYKLSIKENECVSPQEALVVILQSIAIMLKINKIIGVCAFNQICVGRKINTNIHLGTYDQLWLSSGGIINFRGDFVIPPVPFEKPMAQIKPGNRARRRRQRHFKRMLFNKISTSLQPFLK